MENDYVSRMTEKAEYWNDKLHYIRSSRYELWNSDYMEFLIKKVWKIEKKVDILDFGCGNGYLAGLMMRMSMTDFRQHMYAKKVGRMTIRRVTGKPWKY